MTNDTRWYVFDAYDCLDSFDTVEAASKYTVGCVGEFYGLEIRQFTDWEFRAYCRGDEHLHRARLQRANELVGITD